MAIGNFVSNQGTQTGIIVDTIGTSVMAIQKIDISPLGSDGTIWGGNIGTITTLPNIPGGTINAGTVTVTGGTITNSGTTTGVGVVSSLTTGSIVIIGFTQSQLGTLNSGTINVGTIGGKAASGAASIANPVQIAGTDSGGTIYSPLINTNGAIGSVTGLGTITNVAQIYNAGTIQNGTLGAVTTVTTVSNLTNGSIKVTAGTEVITGGTINAGTFTVNGGTIQAGTINTGTINAGTFRLDPLPVIDTISNQGTVGTTAIGTLIGTATIGVGTGVYITGYEVMVISGNPEVCLSFGTQTNNSQVITHGLFSSGGGVTKAKIYPHAYGTTQSPLTFQILSGSGTVAWSVDYFLHT